MAMAKHKSKIKNHQNSSQTQNELIEDHDQTWNDLSDDGDFNQITLSTAKSKSKSTTSINQTRTSSSSSSLSSSATSSYSSSKKKQIPSHPSPSTQLTSPALDSTSQSSSQPAIHPSVTQNIFDLIRDPAYILTSLKTEQDQLSSQSFGEDPGDIFRPTPTKTMGALPWETVIPPDPFGKQQTKPSPHPSPPASATELPPAPYQLLPLISERENKTNEQERRKQKKFIECLENPTVDVTELRKLSWSGIPFRLRSLVWQILLGYLPAPQSRRIEALARKRQEYQDAVRLAFGNQNQRLDQSIWHQIQIDVARTNPGVSLWQFPATQRSLERILYVWAIRHPASGYVQGINDLVTPFFQVFLTTYIDHSTIEVETYDVSNLPSQALEAIEADSFWSLSKLLEGIQDNYIFAQPGIQRQVARLKELCERVDARLHKHLEDEKVEFIQFAFRWINCLLMRELSTKKIIRMWDTYLAEGTAAFSEFHLYVCLAFLVKYSNQLRAMDFQSIIMFLQALPTQELDEKDLEFLLSQAFMWHSLFQGATGHFVRK